MTGIILQARMGSSRLPGKVLKPLGGLTMLGYILRRLTYLKTPDIKVVVATSLEAADDAIAKYCTQVGCEYFRGSETNVLERYYQCAQLYKMDYIIRLTGDNPFVDVDELDALIQCIIKTDSDYVNSFKCLPYGVGAEIFTFASLRKAYQESIKPHHFEHVNEYILEHPELFKTQILQVEDKKKRPDIRLTVDTLEDYKKAVFIVNHCLGEYISTQEAIDVCSMCGVIT